MLSYPSSSTSDTKKLGYCLGKSITPNSLIFLHGGLGAGKTTLVQGLAKGLGITKKVNSPTFNIVKEYSLPWQKNCRLIHIDAYRINSADELLNLGIQGSMLQDNFVVIEWAEKIKKELRRIHIQIELKQIDEKTRIIKMKFPASYCDAESKLKKAIR